MYDLRAPGRNYNELYEAIRAYGTWAKITESSWAILSEHSASLVRDNLLQHIDANDRIFVIKSGQYAAWRNVIGTSDWFQKHLNKV
ncbi:CRISPR-associated protein Cas2 [Pedobacter terrae]|uniref:CRISPR-associated protein Cas2 n=1 Tax=Pedobacter terrae TaxID=405671 RepID=UPI002FF57E4F